MAQKHKPGASRTRAEADVEEFAAQLGPFVVAADTTRMPMLFVNGKSDENEIVYANQSFLRLTGYSRSELRSKPFFELLSQDQDRPPKTLNDLAAISEFASTIIRCVRNRGKDFDAAVFVSPVVDEEGALQQYFVSFVDLSELNERLQQERDSFTEKYRNARSLIVITEGESHCITFTNAAFEELVGGRDLLGKTAGDAIPELENQEFFAALDNVIRTGQKFANKRLPVVVGSAGGASETRYVEFVLQPVRDRNGKVTSVFAEGWDVTDLETTAAKLRVTQDQLIHVARFSAIGTLAASLAHELNQPLAAICNYSAGCTRIIQTSGFQSQSLQEGLEAIEHASVRAGDIIRTLRSLTRKAAPRKERFALSDALTAAVDLLRAGGCDGIEVSSRINSSALVEADRTQIEQVIINLLKNACEAGSTRPVTAVEASVLQESGQVRLTVQDNGSGIPPEVQNDLFKWVDSTKPDGMGIGLSISRTIIESNGGRIALDHTSDEGSCFSFWLSECV